MASIDQISDLFDTKVKGIVDKLEGRIGANEAKTEEAHKRIDGHDKRLEIVEAKLAGGTSHSNFVSKSVYVKGICDYDLRKDKGMSRTEAEALVQRLCAELPTSIKDKLGDVHLRGLKVHKFKIDVAPEHAEEIAASCKDILKKDEFHHNGMIMYTVAEQHPDIEKRKAGGGKARAFLSTKCQGTAKAYCSWQPDYILSVGDENNRVAVGNVLESGKVAFDEEGCQKAFKTAASDMDAALRSFQ